MLKSITFERKKENNLPINNILECEDQLLRKGDAQM